MTEQQPYAVVAQRSGFELRRYPAHLVAEIEVEGTFEHAAYRGFGPLAAFINGANLARRRIAMTAPVTQELAEVDRSESTLVPDTAGGRYVVQFVMPAEMTDETIPAPSDPRLHTREIPGHLAAAVRFSGRWTRAAFEERAAALHTAVVAAGLRPAGPMRYTRFNPPWTPWFARRNEVVLPVEE